MALLVEGHFKGGPIHCVAVVYRPFLISGLISIVDIPSPFGMVTFMAMLRTLSRRQKLKHRSARSAAIGAIVPGALVLKFSDVNEAFRVHEADREKLEALRNAVGIFTVSSILMDDLDTLKDFIRSMPDKQNKVNFVRSLTGFSVARDYQIKALTQFVEEESSILVQ